MAEVSALDWQLRHVLISGFAESGRAPSAEEAAVALGVDVAAARAGIHRLHDAHLLLLDGRGEILMMHPFSNVPTGFRVNSGGTGYDANCAWDSLGIPAALHRDGVITAQLPGGEGKMRMVVRGGALEAEPAFVHFLLPLRHWYDDLVYT